MGNILINDEPVDHDDLGRSRIIDNLAGALRECETPFVIAVNGGWGTGKTSILKCLEKIFKQKKMKSLRTVWFSPWRFQFEDSPAVSLLQQIRSTAEEENWLSIDKAKRKTSKILDIVGSLAGEIVLKTITGHSVSTKDIMNQGAAFEEKYFEAKQLTSRMQEEFQKAIEDIVGKKGRLIFFIDDLDRCRTRNSLRLLEALKLFLNAKNCVYVIAIDMDNLARNLKDECEVSNPFAYMEKIFQLIYSLPVPAYDDRVEFIRELFHKYNPGIFDKNAMLRVSHDLADFMGGNPRALKHFCNRFLLESPVIEEYIRSLLEKSAAQESNDKDYNPMVHIFLQILQHCFPTVFKLFYNQNVIIVNPDPIKDFDKFVWEWYKYFTNNPEDGTEDKPEDGPEDGTEDLYLEFSLFEGYFALMPCLSEKNALEEPYKFVIVSMNESRYTGIVCLEEDPKNKKIEAGANLSGIEDLSGTLLRNLNLSGCLLDRCSFDKADMTRTDISKSDCSRSTLKDTMFKSAKAAGTIFERADLTGLSFEGADFTGADFSNAIMNRALWQSIKESDEDEE